MCGRFTQRADRKALLKSFEVADVPTVEPRYNIAPTQDVLGVHQSPDGREASFYRWGIIPSWAKDASMGARLINARSETVAEKPAFRQAFRQRRCVIPHLDVPLVSHGRVTRAARGRLWVGYRPVDGGRGPYRRLSYS